MHIVQKSKQRQQSMHSLHERKPRAKILACTVLQEGQFVVLKEVPQFDHLAALWLDSGHDNKKAFFKKDVCEH